MLPLEDVRVLAIEQFGAGPWATMQLADLGADVIKIEDPRTGGDAARPVPPYHEGTNSLYFESMNRNKRSITLDLRSEAGREAFQDLVRVSDAVFSNLRGDQPAKRRLTYADLAPLNPRIVCVSLSGFGMTGPRAGQGAYDATIQGLTGWMSITGGPDEPPTRTGISLVDFSAAYVAALALVAGVWQARREGVGRDVDVSLFETALSLLNYLATWTASRGWTAQRMADSAHQTIIPFQRFTAADGNILVACMNDSLWRRFAEAIGRADLARHRDYETIADRDRNRAALLPQLTARMAERPVVEWVEAFDAVGVPCAPVNDIAAALADPQAEARGSVASYEHPVLGDVRTPASPLGATLVREAERAPLLGEHTTDVLTRLCGYDEQRLRELESAGAFGDAAHVSGEPVQQHEPLA